eukprot:Sspe_Gene.36878::Locus_17817_Transcript_1_1_Confidence_1.000_Length_1654::g.36878::m.36878/K06911/K06911; uncharacterized protein
MSKTIMRQVGARPARNCGGAGNQVRRVIGEFSSVDYLDPILLIDECHATLRPKEADPLPWTPYCGFLRLLYVKRGGLQWTGRHPEKGDKQGRTEQGDLLVLHSGGGALVEEMAADELYANGGTMHTFEIWIKDPIEAFGVEPLIDTYANHELHRVRGDGWEAVVLLGTYSATQVPNSPEKVVIETITPSKVIDFALFGKKTIEIEIPEGWNSCIYIYEGEIEVQNSMQMVKEGTMVVFERQGTRIEAWAKGGEAGSVSRFLLVAGKPLHEGYERKGTLVAENESMMKELMNDPILSACHAKLDSVRQKLADVEQGEEQYRRVSSLIIKNSPRTPRSPGGTPRGIKSPRTAFPTASSQTKATPRKSAADVAELKRRIENLKQLRDEGTPGLDDAIAATQQQLDLARIESSG